MKTTTPTTPAKKPNQFAATRRASVPLVMYETSDPAETIRNVIASLNGNAEKTALMQYDVARLFTGINQLGETTVRTLGLDPMLISNPFDFLTQLNLPANLPALSKGKDNPGAIVFFHQAHRFMNETPMIQALWNLRDTFKKQGTCLVLLCIAGSKPPVELADDVMILTDPKPDATQAAAIIKRIATSAQKQGAAIDPDKVSTDTRTIDSTLGTSGFGIEQVFSMSVEREGLNTETLTERQRRMIEQTKGLAVMTIRETINDIAGHRNAIGFFDGILRSGRTPVNCIAFFDELDKSLGAGEGDTSGTSQDQRGTFLKVTQDYNVPAAMLIGPGGTGKSLIAKAAGTISGAITIGVDLGACKGSLVGESEKLIRAMFDTLLAVSQGKLLIIATCNRLGALTPEIRRRFKLGTFFVDLLDKDERAACWKLKRAKFDIEPTEANPASAGWTGAEIEACCEIAYRRNCTLANAARYIVPVSVSAREEVEALRKNASGKFISAAYDGSYEYKPIVSDVPAAVETTDRSFNL